MQIFISFYQLCTCLLLIHIIWPNISVKSLNRIRNSYTGNWTMTVVQGFLALVGSLAIQRGRENITFEIKQKQNQ